MRPPPASVAGSANRPAFVHFAEKRTRLKGGSWDVTPATFEPLPVSALDFGDQYAPLKGGSET